MISIKNYLYRDAIVEREAQFRRMIDLLLQAIGLHAIEGEKGDYDRFRSDIDKLQKSISEDMQPAGLFLVVGSALRAMEDYNARTSRLVQRQNAEFHHMVCMLTQTIITIGSGSDRSVGRLHEIEKSLERTQRIEDIRVLKDRLGDCLESVRQESMLQKQETQTALHVLQKQMEGSRERMEALAFTAEIDPATGLPGKSEALNALNEAVRSPQDKFLIIAVVSRVQAVNARFGYAVGDKVLGTFAEHFQQGLSAQDKVYRWKGPALMALLKRKCRIEKVRTEIRGFSEVKLEKTMQVGQRTVLIPISASWAVFPVESSAEELIRKVEAFTAAQGSSE